MESKCQRDSRLSTLVTRSNMYLVRVERLVSSEDGKIHPRQLQCHFSIQAPRPVTSTVRYSWPISSCDSSIANSRLESSLSLLRSHRPRTAPHTPCIFPLFLFLACHLLIHRSALHPYILLCIRNASTHLAIMDDLSRSEYPAMLVSPAPLLRCPPPCQNPSNAINPSRTAHRLSGCPALPTSSPCLFC